MRRHGEACPFLLRGTGSLTTSATAETKRHPDEFSATAGILNAAFLSSSMSSGDSLRFPLRTDRKNLSLPSDKTKTVNRPCTKI